MVIVFLLAAGSFGLWFVSGHDAGPQVKEIYILKVFEKNPEKIKNLTGIITEEGYEFTSEKVKKTLSKPIGYTVRQSFDKSQNPDKFLKFLKKKKIAAKIKEDPDSEKILIEVIKVFKKEKEAKAKQDQIRGLLTIQFEIIPITKEFPYTTNEIKIENIPDQEKLEALKLKLSEHIKNPDRDIEVETITVEIKPGEPEEGKATEDNKEKTPDEPESESTEKKEGQEGEKEKESEEK